MTRLISSLCALVTSSVKAAVCDWVVTKRNLPQQCHNLCPFGSLVPPINLRLRYFSKPCPTEVWQILRSLSGEELNTDSRSGSVWGDDSWASGSGTSPEASQCFSVLMITMGTSIPTVGHIDGKNLLWSSSPDWSLVGFAFSLLLIWLDLYSLFLH